MFISIAFSRDCRLVWNFISWSRRARSTCWHMLPAGTRFCGRAVPSSGICAKFQPVTRPPFGRKISSTIVQRLKKWKFTYYSRTTVTFWFVPRAPLAGALTGNCSALAPEHRRLQTERRLALFISSLVSLPPWTVFYNSQSFLRQIMSIRAQLIRLPSVFQQPQRHISCQLPTGNQEESIT